MDTQLLKKAGIAAIVLMAIIAISFYFGDRHGRVNERLATNQVQITKSDSSIKSVQIRTDSMKRDDTKLIAKRNIDRASIKIVHDTIYTDTTDTDNAIYSPAVAKLLVEDDSIISSVRRELALRDTLEAGLYKGLKLRDERIALLSGPKHVSNGAQVGVGYCRTLTQGVPCIYVGFGYSFR